MPETLTLPNGDVVTPEDVFLYNGYPYRYVPIGDPDAAVAFYLSPLYWGGGDMDVPFRSREDLEAQWEESSRGTLTPEEWEAWLREARANDQFSAEELDAVRRAVTNERSETGDGLLGRLRRLFRG